MLPQLQESSEIYRTVLVEEVVVTVVVALTVAVSVTMAAVADHKDEDVGE